MSFPDSQKIPTDGLFMFSMRTVTMTSFLLGGIHADQHVHAFMIMKQISINLIQSRSLYN